MSTDYDIIKLYQPPSECGDVRCQNDLLDLIYCVIIPAGVLVLLLLFLALIMCSTSKSCRCRKYANLDPPTNPMQLETYNSIRRVSASLRHMSQNREIALMGNRTESMTFDRSLRRPHRTRNSSHSAPGTLQRQNRSRSTEQSEAGPPPPYTKDKEDTLPLYPRGASHAPSPPPPPAYGTHTDDVFMGPEFLHSDLPASVRYQDRSENGTQPLLALGGAY